MSDATNPSTNTQQPGDALQLGALLPLIQVFCCCIPVSAAAPGLSRRARFMILGSWLSLTALGWALSAAGAGG